MRRTVGLLLAGALAGCGTAPAGGAPAVGAPAPEYQAAALDGDTVSLADFGGEAVLLNVWATWCAPCREEMPAIEALHRELGGSGLRVVAVSVDRRGAAGDIRRFAGDLDLTFRMLHDPEERIVRTFRTRGVPETFLIAPDGTLLQRWIGQIDPREPHTRRQIAEAAAAARVTAQATATP
jgi:peroxiredoxin